MLPCSCWHCAYLSLCHKLLQAKVEALWQVLEGSPTLVNEARLADSMYSMYVQWRSVTGQTIQDYISKCCPLTV